VHCLRYLMSSRLHLKAFLVAYFVVIKIPFKHCSTHLPLNLSCCTQASAGPHQYNDDPPLHSVPKPLGRSTQTFSAFLPTPLPPRCKTLQDPTCTDPCTRCSMRSHPTPLRHRQCLATKPEIRRPRRQRSQTRTKWHTFTSAQAR
jgi:hypothetical protein